MPEFKITVPPFQCINDTESEMSSQNNEDDDLLYKLLGLAEIHIPQLTYNPLPLQCLAADALPGNVKEEIDHFTQSSIKEIRRMSNSSSTAGGDQFNKRDSTSNAEEIDCEMDARENVISVPLQFLSNGRTVRLVGGVMCRHSNEVHAQIMCTSDKKNGEENSLAQMATLHGQCVLAFNGISLRGASFEQVRKMVKSTRDILVKLTIKDCSRDSNKVITTIEQVPNTTLRLTEETTTNTTRELNNDHSKLLTLQKYRIFQRRFSVDSKAQSHTGLVQTRTKLTKNHSKSTASLNQSELARSVSIVASPINGEERSLTEQSKLQNKKISLHSLDSSIPTNGMKKAATPPGILRGMSAMNNTLLSQYNVGMPNGMIQLGLSYVKAHKTLYISVFKVKYSSISLNTENSSCFYNTYITPDKRSQSVKYAKMMSLTLATESIHSRSANYILTEDELKTTSVRIIIWEQSSQPFATKKYVFKGEVFLDLNDTDFVNLHGVPQFYTICQPDPNLPPLPQPFHDNGATLVRKMMDSTFGAMTLKRKKKEKKDLASNLTSTKADSLMSLSDMGKSSNGGSIANLSKVLQPLKDPKETVEAPPLVYCPVMIRPATVEMSVNDSPGMSLFDFLSDMDPPARDNHSDTTDYIGLPQKTSLFSSYHELNTAKDTFENDRRASCLSDGNETVSYPIKHRRRGSLFSFLSDTFNRPGSRMSQTDFNNSILSSSSELSSSLSSVSVDKSKDGSRFQGWSEASSNKSEHYDSISNFSVHSSESHRRSNRSITNSNPGNSPMHNSIFVRTHSISADQSPSPTGTCNKCMTKVHQTNNTTLPLLDNGSYSCNQVPVISSDSDPCTPMCSNNTLIPSITMTPSYIGNNNTTDSTVPNTVKALNQIDSLRVATLPLNSTPKKAQQDIANIRYSKSLGNFSEELKFVDDNGGDGDSFGQFIERELSCLDISNIRSVLVSSQDNSVSSTNLSLSQRDALESSDCTSSLDFSHSSPLISGSAVVSKKILSLSNSQPDGNSWSVQEDLKGQQSPRMSNTFHVNTAESPVRLHTHKWSSMDNLRATKHTDVKDSPKLRSKVHKTPSLSIVEKLSNAYENGKPKGSVKLQVTAKLVTSRITVDIVDLSFFNARLMNGDFEVKANLYNRHSERCEHTLKGRASIRKNGSIENKELPSSFVFSVSPIVYYLQVVFQISNKIFGKTQYHVWIDIKNAVTDKPVLYHLNKLSL